MSFETGILSLLGGYICYSEYISISESLELETRLVLILQRYWRTKFSVFCKRVTTTIIA